MPKTKLDQSDWMILDKDGQVNSIYFHSLAHSNTLLNGLNELRRHGHLMDVTLLAEGRQFKAHRAVLASCSDYFRAMFTDEMRESQLKEISLSGISAIGIDLILTYAYTSQLLLNLANIQDVLAAANYVQMDAVVQACSNYLEQQLDLENCVDIITIAETYSLEILRQRAYRFICSKFLEFSSSIDLFRLTWYQLREILACDYPVNCCESSVLRIVLQWINTNTKDLKIIHQLLHFVHLSEIPMDELRIVLMDANYDPACQLFKSTISLAGAQTRLKMVKKTNTWDTVNPIAAVDLTNVRGMELSLVKVGGFRSDGITNDITYYSPSLKKWHHLTSIPHVEQCNYGTVVQNNELYVVGGCYNVSLREYIHPFGFRYSPLTNKWATIAPMQQDRCRFSLNFVDKCMYAIGGAVEDVDELSDAWFNLTNETNSECYNPETDTWEYIVGIPENRTQHAGAALNNRLYISGGLDRNRVLSTMWRYDPISNAWEQMPQMLQPRADHSMLTIGGKLYICGGWLEENSMELSNRRLVDTIDKYNPDSRTWETITKVPTPKYHTGTVAIGKKIYIIGGFYSDSVYDRASSTVECYDLDKNEWSNFTPYPQHTWECTCVTLFIPKFRDDMEVLYDENSNNNNVV